MDSLTKKHRTMLVTAAVYNWTVALAFLKPAIVCGFLQVSPIPEEGLALHVLVAFVALFGVAYYQASRDVPAHANLLWLGMVAKVLVNVITVMDILLGFISWQAIFVAVGDLVYAGLFYQVLDDVKREKTPKTLAERLALQRVKHLQFIKDQGLIKDESRDVTKGAVS